MEFWVLYIKIVTKSQKNKIMVNKINDALEKTIGYRFKNVRLLKTVFTHRSYINEHRGEGLEHNERLEFLGDAVLELVVTSYLYNKYSEPEGVLTSWRSALVRGTSLSDVAKKIDLDDKMLFSKGEKKAAGKSREVILANAVEALIGAIYLDDGYEAACVFIDNFIIDKLEVIIKEGKYIDAKSHLQELVQEKMNVTPVYKIISESGPDHAKLFVTGVWAGNKELGRGEGASKRDAEQSAAREALDKMPS